MHLQLQNYLTCAARSFSVRTPEPILTENAQRCSSNNYNCGINVIVNAQNSLFSIGDCGYNCKRAFTISDNLALRKLEESFVFESHFSLKFQHSCNMSFYPLTYSTLIILSTVDFPQPLGPSRQVIVPFSHSREKSTVTVSHVL